VNAEVRVGLIAGLDGKEKGAGDKGQATFADLMRE
jgi:hypothetical protein